MSACRPKHTFLASIDNFAQGCGVRGSVSIVALMLLAASAGACGPRAQQDPASPQPTAASGVEPGVEAPGDVPSQAEDQPDKVDTATAKTTDGDDAKKHVSPKKSEAIARVLAAKPGDSTSLGAPNNGDLKGGIALPATGPGYLANPKKDPDSRYGTVELVQAIVRAAEVVEREYPGGELLVGDLSRPEGGVIKGHGSHQAGRDVDVLFYLLDSEGKPMRSVAAPLDPAGEGTDYKDLADPSDDVPVKIDVPRTWKFIEALLAQEQVYVQRLFLVEHLRSMLIDHATKSGAPKPIIARFADLTCQPGFPHDDHLHIRLFCSPEDISAGCRDMKPIYPWHQELLKAAGVKAKLASGKRRKGIKLTSTKEARAKAGPMHQDVVDFLDRREAWVRKPHPGRKYCR